MSNYKPGDKVISIHADAWCAPEGMVCEVIKERIGISNAIKNLHLYEVLGSDNNIYRHYEDELKPAPTGCDYCKKGKNFNTISFGDVTIKSYIIGNRLYTDAYDAAYEEEDGKQEKITQCPFCGSEVHEEPDEEMEEEVDE